MLVRSWLIRRGFSMKRSSPSPQVHDRQPEGVRAGDLGAADHPGEPHRPWGLHVRGYERLRPREGWYQAVGTGAAEFPPEFTRSRAREQIAAVGLVVAVQRAGSGARQLAYNQIHRAVQGGAG